MTASTTKGYFMMTYEQAQEQAKQLRQQGMTYPKIAEHLKRAGYVSPYSKSPVGHLAVRLMVTKEGQEPREEPTKPVEVVSPKAELLELIKALSTATEIDVNVRLRLIKLAIKDANEKV